MPVPQVYTEQQKLEFKEQFRARRRRQMLATLPLLACVALMFWFRRQPGAQIGGLSLDQLLPWLGVLVVGFIVFTLVNWRCPACRRYLGKGIGPNFCRKCGIALE